MDLLCGSGALEECRNLIVTLGASYSERGAALEVARIDVSTCLNKVFAKSGIAHDFLGLDCLPFSYLVVVT